MRAIWTLAAALMLSLMMPYPAILAEPAVEEAEIAAFYAGRDQKALWYDEDGLRDGARRLLDRLKQAEAEGLDPGRYPIGAIEEAMASGDPATLDPLLSRTLVRYTRDLRRGQVEPAIDYTDETLQPSSLTAGEVLTAASQAASLAAFVDGLSAHNPIYTRLRAALARARAEGRPGAEITTIIANMERARWLPPDMGARFLLVDTAGFELKLFAAGQEIGAMRTVVGKEYQRTPMFADRMTYVEINPYWNIPNSILKNEIAPAVVQQGNGYLRRRNMEALSGWGEGARVIRPSRADWRAATRGDIRFRVRQKPGPNNALGRIKFMFPNKYAVYLHDTPADHLFERARRTFSHGCVRVEQPMDLAAFVFAAMPDWDAARVQATIDSGRRRVVHLDEPLPVYLTYFTAWPALNGDVEFREDVYDKDGELKARLGLQD